MKINKTNLFSIIVGIVFIVSSFSKSLDSTSFAETINSYQIGNLWFLSPIIIIVEMFLGLSLLLRIQIKRISFISLIFLIILTLTYLYGWLFNDITDCGCFGHINILNSSPIFTLVRNAVLIYLCTDLWLSNEKESTNNKTYIYIALMTAMCIVSFISGYTLEEVGYKKKNKELPAIKDTALSSYVNISQDSTYLVFAFSYSCSHCMNSIENLKQYEKSGLVDKVIALTVNDDDEGREKFERNFEPNFEIRHIEKKELIGLTRSFPRSFFIQNDTLQFTLSGELPSAYVLKDILDKRKR